MDVATFRTNFPEFTDATVYTDGIVNFWLIVATSILNQKRWGALYDLGIQLFVAHNIVIQAKDQANPGQAVNLKTSKGVADVSVGMDTNSTTVQDAGNWNLTTYGTRFAQFSKIAGMGGAQV